MLEYYHRKGYSENWINQRLKSIEVRKELTDEWERRGIKKGQEFATLTDIITLGWSGMTTRQYKQFKGLKTESLRDNMTNLELVLNMLAEAHRSSAGRPHSRKYPPRDRSPDGKENRFTSECEAGVSGKGIRADRGRKRLTAQSMPRTV